MALNQIQRAQLDRRLGKFCESRVPPHVRNQLRLGYRIGLNDVVLFESRPSFRRPREWQDEDIAKFRYVNAAQEWRLYCQFRDLKWRAYAPLPSAKDFATLLEEVDHDPTGIFWG